MLAWRSICCAVDFSPASLAAVDVAAELARRFGAKLIVLHADQLPGYTLPDGPAFATADKLAQHSSAVREKLDALVKRARGTGDLEVDSLNVVGDPATEILRHVENSRSDLVVMGTHGRTGIAHALLGSVAEKVVRSAPCAVLTLKARQ